MLHGKARKMHKRIYIVCIGMGDIAVKVTIFDNDISTLERLKTLLTNHGHKVRAFPEPHICSFNLLGDNQCPSSTACADAVIVNMKRPTLSVVEALTGLSENGCKIPLCNKAIMSSAITDEEERQIMGEGLHVIRKPFRLTEVLEWVKQVGAGVEAISSVDQPCAPVECPRSG